jgi:hypothetical protein
VAKYRSRAYHRAIESYEPEIVIVDHLQAPAPPIDARTVYNAANAEYEMYEQLDGRLMRREAKHVRKAESELVQRVDESWTVSRADADALERIGAKRTRVFDMPASAPPPPPRLPDPEIDAAMLGTWTWGANAVGLEWFDEQIRPRLNGLRVEVAGLGSERGPVDDAEAFLRRARVVIVPKTSGTGIQIKTLNAIASGRAVVAAWRHRGRASAAASSACRDGSEAASGARARRTGSPTAVAARRAQGRPGATAAARRRADRWCRGCLRGPGRAAGRGSCARTSRRGRACRCGCSRCGRSSRTCRRARPRRGATSRSSRGERSRRRAGAAGGRTRST